MSDEHRFRIVLQRSSNGEPSGLNIYLNSAGQLELLRVLARLGPSNRYEHLEALLTPVEGEREIVWADVIFTDGRGDVAHAPPNSRSSRTMALPSVSSPLIDPGRRASNRQRRPLIRFSPGNPLAVGFRMPRAD